MTTECRAIAFLRELAQQGDTATRGASIAAAAALRIIADVRENHLTRVDVEGIHMLVDDIYKNGHPALLTHLRHGAADCDICAALVARLPAED